jgi:serine/threonine protein kinase
MTVSTDIASDTTSISASATSQRRPIEAMPESLGRYRLEHVLGKGGGARVFAGHDPRLGRAVAIKVFHLSTPIEDITREAMALARVTHPNVIAVHDVGDANGVAYLVMDLAHGGTLVEYMRAPHDWREIVSVFVQVGRALAFVHAAGLAHGDIKPSNILIDRDGRPLIADFGLASASVDSGTKHHGGTAHYMAPERHAGHPPNAASDQFSFCVTCWEALHGVRPWETTTDADVRGHVPRDGRSRPVPALVHRVLRRGLAVDPRDRFESVGALVEALTDVINADARRLTSWRTLAAVLASVALAGLLDRCM